MRPHQVVLTVFIERRPRGSTSNQQLHMKNASPALETLSSGRNIYRATVWVESVLLLRKHALLEFSKKMKARSSLLVSIIPSVQGLLSQPSPICCIPFLMEKMQILHQTLRTAKCLTKKPQAQSHETNRNFARLHASICHVADWFLCQKPVHLDLIILRSPV